MNFILASKTYLSWEGVIVYPMVWEVLVVLGQDVSVYCTYGVCRHD